jgi:hypothetical protein
MVNRQLAIRFLLRKPDALESPIAYWTVMTLAGTGAAFLVWSAVIHLQLWADGYQDISVIGPLFLVQAIACIILAVAIVEFTAAFVLLAGVGVLALAKPARTVRRFAPAIIGHIL